MKAVELFTGAGGLAMGVSLAGFELLAAVEWDRRACDTIRRNQQHGFPLVTRWPLIECDVRKLDLSAVPEGIDLVAGGSPCQPFSIGGKHRAYEDERDMFPATVEVIRRLIPKAFILENVPGLARAAFSDYFGYIRLQLEFPEAVKKADESWKAHYARLQREKRLDRIHGSGALVYDVVTTLVDAADYGIPQRRKRVFIVGFRDDLGIKWSFPHETHSLNALLHDQWVSGTYWERHRVPMKDRPRMPSAVASKVERMKKSGTKPQLLPWRTVRDALVGLPDPEELKDFKGPSDHHFRPRARAYPGHTGSPLDLPAKTLKAGDHGVPGGENMLVKPNGEVRYFTVREAARIQTFPDSFVFHGSWSETMRQLGNAVPVELARLVACSVAEKLAGAEGIRRPHT